MVRSQYALPNQGTTRRSDDPRGLEGYIRETAVKHGVDPDIAVKVAKSEGLRDFSGDGGKSGGAFQLYTGGGLGNTFQKDTGLDPLDPKNEKATIDYALQKASQGGWGPWHGAKKVGVGEYDGISGSGASAQGASDGKIPETTIGSPPAGTDTAQTGFAGPPGGASDQSGMNKTTLKEGLGDVFAGLGKAIGGAGANPATVPAQPVPVAQPLQAPQVVPMVDPRQADAQRQQLAAAMQRLNSGRLV
jgi:hypothetical protein